MLFLRTLMQHLRRRLLVASPVIACCMLVTAGSAQEAVLHDGNPALVFQADENNTITVDLVDHGGERALRIPVRHAHLLIAKICTGYLYVSRNRIAYDPLFTPEFAKDAFDLDRSNVKKARVRIGRRISDNTPSPIVEISKYNFWVLPDSRAATQAYGPKSEVYQLIDRSLTDFDNALHDAEQLTAKLGQHPAESAVEHPSQAEQPAKAASNALSADLKEGQTPAEVEAALGKPEDVTKAKENLIYTYPTVKVFFENGKLVNVEERHKPETPNPSDATAAASETARAQQSSLAHDVTENKSFALSTMLGSQEKIDFSVIRTGTIVVEAIWDGSTPLALILNGPGQVQMSNGAWKRKLYARQDGRSPIRVQYRVAEQDLSDGSNWTVSIVNFSQKAPARGTLRAVFPRP